MIAGTFAYGPMDRIFGTRKWIIFIGSSVSLVSLICLALLNEISFGVAVVFFAPLVFWNVISIDDRSRSKFFARKLNWQMRNFAKHVCNWRVGIFQFLTGRIFSKLTEVHNNNHEAYTIIFLFYASALFWV